MKYDKPLETYLSSSTYINYQDPQIQEIIMLLKNKSEYEIDRAQAAFEYVRDEIKHSYDIQSQEVTRKASEVLEKRHGICYAKSHLLAALLRGMGIPAGICYQRLTLYDKPEDGFCIHALNTVYLKEVNRWIRLDARGNKPGVDAQFLLGEERLAFPIREEYGEKDYLTNFSEPHPDIVQVLEKYHDCLEMYQHGLPTELIG